MFAHKVWHVSCRFYFLQYIIACVSCNICLLDNVSWIPEFGGCFRDLKIIKLLTQSAKFNWHFFTAGIRDHLSRGFLNIFGCARGFKKCATPSAGTSSLSLKPSFQIRIDGVTCSSGWIVNTPTNSFL